MTAFADEQAAASVAAEAADDAGPWHTAEGQGAEPQGGAAAPDDPLADLKVKARLSESLQREIKRLHGVLKATKEQNQQLRDGSRVSGLGSREADAEVSEGDAAESDAVQPDDEQVDQAEEEPDGLVEFAGMRLTPEVAQRLMQAEQLASKLEQLEGALGQRGEDELLSEMSELANAYETNTAQAVIELRRQIIPLEGEAEQIADEVLLALVNQDMAQASREDGLTIFDLTPERIHEFGLRAVDRLHKAFSIFGTRQLQSNQQYRETHRAVRPGGSPAVQPPKGWKQMTPAERDEFLARSAAAVLRRGSG